MRFNEAKRADKDVVDVDDDDDDDDDDDPEADDTEEEADEDDNDDDAAADTDYLHFDLRLNFWLLQQQRLQLLPEWPPYH